MLYLSAMLLAPTALAQDAPEPTPAEDADMERAKLLFQNGKDLFDEARYRDAITAWEEAYRLTDRAALLYNISSAYERLAEYEQAIEVLNKYRVFADAEERAQLERKIDNLERLAREQRAQREQNQAAAQPAGPAPAPPPPKKKASAGRVVGFALTGVGVAGVAVGTAVGLAARTAGAEARDLCVEKDDGLLCPGTARDAVDQSRGRAAAADAALIGGVVATGVGVALVLTQKGTTVSVSPDSVRIGGRL